MKLLEFESPAYLPVVTGSLLRPALAVVLFMIGAYLCLIPNSIKVRTSDEYRNLIGIF